MNNDPTIYPTRQPIESTEPAYNFNPGESTEPYYFNPYAPDTPYSLTPPPPPKVRRKTKSILLAWIISIVGLLLVGLIIFFGIAGLPWQQSHATSLFSTPTTVSTVVPTVTVIPTTIPTPTAAPTPISTASAPIMTGGKAPYPASQIIGDFYQAGLAPSVFSIDTSWSCCTYYPEGGAGYWTDTQTGITMDLATFASIDEAQIDGRDLANRGYGAYVTNYCLLSYGGNPSDLQSYLDIMNQACFYE